MLFDYFQLVTLTVSFGTSRKMVSYFIISLLITLVAIIAASVYTIKRTKPVSILTNVMRLMLASGVMRFLHKTGLNKRMRPKHGELTLPNGFKIVTPSPFFNIMAPEIMALKVRQDDVYIVTYPKAGTTWLQEIVWLICNNADTVAAKNEALASRVPFLEGIDIVDAKGIQTIQKCPEDSRRLIKTHMPFELLPDELREGKKCKIVYLARNPKDLCVSYYHFYKMNTGMPEVGTWSDFFTRFSTDQAAWGSWFEHNLAFWRRFQQNDERIYFTTYEKLKKDLRAELIPLAKFLEKDLTSEQMDSITQHCSFDSMSKNDKTNYSSLSKISLDFSKSKFMRKGQVGDWKNYFTLNQNKAFDIMFEMKMKDSGLKIEFEI